MTLAVTDDQPFVLHLPAGWQKLGDGDFWAFCQANPERRIEQTAEGDIIVMPSTGGETGNRNFNLAVEFGIWCKVDNTGIAFDSSTVFRLPNGAKRSPDLSWVKRNRWEALTAEERRRFPPLCPDFVVELRSRTDSLDTLKDKMEEYLANGAQLGWLIDPEGRKVMIYQQGEQVKSQDDPQEVTGDPVLPGFVLEMRTIWGD